MRQFSHNLVDRWPSNHDFGDGFLVNPPMFFISVTQGLRPAKPHENPSTSGKPELMTLTPLISASLDLRPRVFRKSRRNRGFQVDGGFEGPLGCSGRGVVFHAAGCGVGSGPRPREWRKLFYSEDPWQAHRRVPAKKCDVRYGRKFRSARWHTTSKRSANM